MIGNGKKVIAKGNLPSAKNKKADAIRDTGIAKVRKMAGGIVRATSYNYGLPGGKGRKLAGAGDAEDGEE